MTEFRVDCNCTVSGRGGFWDCDLPRCEQEAKSVLKTKKTEGWRHCSISENYESTYLSNAERRITPEGNRRNHMWRERRTYLSVDCTTAPAAKERSPKHGVINPTRHNEQTPKKLSKKQGNIVAKGDLIEKGKPIYSPNRKFKLQFRGNDLALYNGSKVVWQTRGYGAPSPDFKVHAVLNRNGIFEIFGWHGDDRKTLWQIDTHSTNAAHLAVQDDGNVVIYGSNEYFTRVMDPLWATGTNEKRSWVKYDSGCIKCFNYFRGDPEPRRRRPMAFRGTGE